MSRWCEEINCRNYILSIFLTLTPPSPELTAEKKIYLLTPLARGSRYGPGFLSVTVTLEATHEMTHVRPFEESKHFSSKAAPDT